MAAYDGRSCGFPRAGAEGRQEVWPSMSDLAAAGDAAQNTATREPAELGRYRVELTGYCYRVARARHRLSRIASGPGFGQRFTRVRAVPPSGPDGGYEPFALQVIEVSAGQIIGLNFFLDTARLFPLFGLPPHPEP
jgi:hypothetical protein